jgi:ribosomal protein S13
MFLLNKYITLNMNKRLDFILQKFYGLGITHSVRIFSKLGYNKFYNFFIYEDKFDKLLELIMFDYLKLILSLDLRYIVLIHFRKLLQSENYKLQRRKLFLPTRGQRTRKNALTQKLKRFKGSFLEADDIVTKRILKNLDRLENTEIIFEERQQR